MVLPKDASPHALAEYQTVISGQLFVTLELRIRKSFAELCGIVL